MKVNHHSIGKPENQHHPYITPGFSPMFIHFPHVHSFSSCTLSVTPSLTWPPQQPQVIWLVLKPLEDGSAGIELLGPVIFGMLIHVRFSGHQRHIISYHIISCTYIYIY